ncbi:protein kinase superfamily protein [Tanacetum coccineum]
MSVLSEYPDHKKDVQIWNNAVFDSDNQIKLPSWFAKKPVSVNPSSDSFDSSKENQSPTLIGFSKSLHQSKPLKNIPIKVGDLEEKTDEEIEIEKEISRLYAKLECIRRERKQGKTGEVKNGVKKIQEPVFGKVQRRGFSLGPNEIMSAATNSNSKSKQLGTTPVQLTQNRRKSCFWKLDDIEEEKMAFSRGKNLSFRQAVTTVGAKKGVKKDELILASIQPKKLFGEQSVGVKKPLKPGRVIPSRYNQATVNSSMKKRSFADNNVDRKSLTDVRVKKKWEIPSEIVVPKRLDLDENENETQDDVVAMMPVVLPRIRAVRVVDETGRDSGPAKRVAQLVGKKSYFAQEDDEETVCQALSFENDYVTSQVVPITIIEGAVAKGAVCLDGSPPAYQFDAGSGDGVNNWLLHIQGGGWCYSVNDCHTRTYNKYGSSKNMKSSDYNFTGILSNKLELNPNFYNWNRVAIRYCDGSSFTGDIEEVDPATNLHFRGARVFDVIIQELLGKGMKSASKALLSGSSAGGLASILHCDKFRAFFATSTQCEYQSKWLGKSSWKLNNKAIAEAVGDWFYDRSTVQMMDNQNMLPHYCNT